MRALSSIFLAAALALSACGGGGDSPPGPLKNHFDDMYIAQVPLDQKQDMVKAQNDYQIARLESSKADADYAESATILQVVKNDAKAAHTGLDSAIAMKNSAQKSGDMNRTNAATKDERVAEDLAKAADQRVKYYARYREHLKVVARYALETLYWRESQFELAKSTVAQKNNKAIQNVNYAWFPTQESDRAKRAARWKDKLEGSKRETLSARDGWLSAQKTADTENGHATTYATPDPLAAGNADAGGSGEAKQ